MHTKLYRTLGAYKHSKAVQCSLPTPPLWKCHCLFLVNTQILTLIIYLYMWSKMFLVKTDQRGPNTFYNALKISGWRFHKDCIHSTGKQTRSWLQTKKAPIAIISWPVTPEQVFFQKNSSSSETVRSNGNGRPRKPEELLYGRKQLTGKSLPAPPRGLSESSIMRFCVREMPKEKRVVRPSTSCP